MHFALSLWNSPLGLGNKKTDDTVLLLPDCHFCAPYLPSGDWFTWSDYQQDVHIFGNPTLTPMILVL